jgi:hypothetical protein
MSKRIRVPTPRRTGELDRIFRSARPVDEGPEFAMDAIREALLRAARGKVQLGDAIFDSLRNRIEATVPQYATAIRDALTSSPSHPTEPDEAYAAAYAGFRLVDDIMVNPSGEPTPNELGDITSDLMRLVKLTRIHGMRIHVVKTVWPPTR